jgi:SAM-dependent methyltransferase
MAGIEDPAHYGDLWADIYDDEHGFMDPQAAVAFLAELGQGVRVLELGVGTGRVALPLAARGVGVVGIDASQAMVSRLRSKPGGQDIEVTIGDMATTPLGGPFGLVFVVFNTFFGLVTQDRQLECFANVSRSLEDGGRFVLECFVPDVARFRDGNQTLRVISMEDHRLQVNASVHDPVDQRIRTQVVILRDGNINILPAVVRYAWPAELDLMARLAGLELEARFGGWAKEPFNDRSPSHVSVYRRQ